MASAESGPRPLRADAQRSRKLVIDAAKELFATKGIEVGFDEIARHAGVGVGTVYRRFPDRASLVAALFADKLDEVASLTSEALEVSDPWEALVQFCEQIISAQQRDRGLSQVLASCVEHESFQRLQDWINVQTAELLDRARAAGEIRDLEVGDIALLTTLLSRIATASEPELWRRYLQLLLDAIRIHPGKAVTPLPRPAPDHETVIDILTRL